MTSRPRPRSTAVSFLCFRSPFSRRRRPRFPSLGVLRSRPRLRETGTGLADSLADPPPHHTSPASLTPHLSRARHWRLSSHGKPAPASASSLACLSRVTSPCNARQGCASHWRCCTCGIISTWLAVRTCPCQPRVTLALNRVE